MRLQLLFTILVVVFSIGSVYSQSGKITGKVFNGKTGEPLIGASIFLEGTSRGTTTDQNGYYSFSGLSPKNYTITCSYVGFSKKSVPNITVKANEVTNQDIILTDASVSEEVVIKSKKLSRDNTSSLLLTQKNSANVSDGISAESIRKTPDRNTSDVLKRVSGASIQEDRFAIIRGLNDRYNFALINGAPLPSSESDRKAFAFDIFPANMLDNLVIYKTATPDLPGEFAGGVIAVNTKSIPSQDFSSLSVGLGYNTIATLKKRQYYGGGRWDFLGFDDGTRRLPSTIPNPLPASIDERVKLAKQVPNDWEVYSGKALPNINLQYAVGKNFQKKQKDYLGVLFSITYSRSSNNQEIKRYSYDEELSSSSVIPRNSYSEQISSVQTLLGIIANASLKLNNNNSFSLKNLLSGNSDDRLISRAGQNDITDFNELFTKSKAFWFTSNAIYSGQLGGEHYLPKTKLKINWVASYSAIQRNIPLLRRYVYDSIAGSAFYLANISRDFPLNSDGGTFFSSKNKENVENAKFDISRSFNKGFIKTQIKLGGYYQHRDRNFNARIVGFTKYNFNNATFDNNLLALPPEKIFDPRNMGRLKAGKGGFILSETTKITDSYNAETSLLASYLMLDQRFGNFFRLIYGVRIEQFQQKLDAFKNISVPVKVNTTKNDLLPSVNAVFSISPKQNFRLSYSQTVNRPEFRELAPFNFFDFVTTYIFTGNDSLKRASVINYDARYEFYPGRAQLISISGFYKRFTDPIEQISDPNSVKTATLINAISAENYGMELEFRTLIGSLINTDGKSFLNDLTVFSNFSYIKSKVVLNRSGNARVKSDRPLQGQSPYVFNAGINYQDDEKNFGVSLAANRVGQRIFIVGNEFERDIWENGRTVLDLQFSKNFVKRNIEVKLNVKDILAQKLYFFQDFNENKRFDKAVDGIISSNSYGRVISVSINYKL